MLVFHSRFTFHTRGLLMMKALQRIDQRRRARSLLSAVLGRPHAALQRRSANPGLTQSAHSPCLRAILRRRVTRNTHTPQFSTAKRRLLMRRCLIQATSFEHRQRETVISSHGQHT
ncbi:hypothetical protein NDU88_009677 [Pleurodeles waltl]|uniref:Uncharacterized protein n=1 Tax=Pleurodeles waltl TaxID=8319 RepID=A0AAV7PTH9_PLEWA|nr:hypothetical protein NDU88_009677 [Pleurodeles waltl]